MKKQHCSISFAWLNKKTLYPVLRFLFREAYNSPTLKAWAKATAGGRKLPNNGFPKDYVPKN